MDAITLSFPKEIAICFTFRRSSTLKLVSPPAERDRPPQSRFVAAGSSAQLVKPIWLALKLAIRVLFSSAAYRSSDYSAKGWYLGGWGCSSVGRASRSQ